MSSPAPQYLTRRRRHVPGRITRPPSARPRPASARPSQTRAWEDHKAAERQAKTGQREAVAKDADAPEPSVLDDIPTVLPALSRAWKLQKRAARVGFDWPDAEAATAKFSEEAAELSHEIAVRGDRSRLEDEIGDLLFTCVNVARKLDLDPETALRRATAKFERRFRRIEALLREHDGRRPQDASLEELEALWRRAKVDP